MAKVVTLSEAASLAIHAIVLIAGSDNIVNVNMIAKATESSKNHLAKVMQRLVKSGLLSSTRGPAGGFLLKKDASDITLYDIYFAVEGPIELEDCPLGRPVCPFDKCIMGGVIHKLTNDFKKYLMEEKVSNFI
ncbi:MAG: Rrf2 family transcriptional regulator [Bacteroidales bacterium]|jgi:Rrf2 family protein|nr:Rrf2 family transcriptional regulator [Bacteroidales bacterium]